MIPTQLDLCWEAISNERHQLGVSHNDLLMLLTDAERQWEAFYEQMAYMDRKPRDSEELMWRTSVLTRRWKSMLSDPNYFVNGSGI